MTTVDFCICFKNPIAETKKKGSYYSATLKITFLFKYTIKKFVKVTVAYTCIEGQTFKI